MKILHITKKYPNALGGDAVVVSNLQAQQEKQQHQTAILTSNCDEIVPGEHIYKFGIKDTPAALDQITPKRLVSLASLFFKTFKVIRKERPDVIHSHSVDMAFFASFAARFYKVPIIHTFHIVTFYNQQQSALRRKTELLFLKGARPQLVTAPNNYDVEQLRAAGVKHAELLPNGIDLDFWKKLRNSRSKKGKETKRPFTIVTAARLEDQKGHEYLIKAVARLKRLTKQPVKIIVVGTGSLQESLEALVKQKRLGKVFDFAGRKTPGEVRALYAAADAVVIPSLWETTPLSLLEAWAMGLPVISTAVGILQHEGAEKRAALVPTGDEKALAEALAHVINDEKYRKRLARAGKQAVKEYTWDRIQITASKLYKMVLPIKPRAQKEPAAKLAIAKGASVQPSKLAGDDDRLVVRERTILGILAAASILTLALASLLGGFVNALITLPLTILIPGILLMRGSFRHTIFKLPMTITIGASAGLLILMAQSFLLNWLGLALFHIAQPLRAQYITPIQIVITILLYLFYLWRQQSALQVVHARLHLSAKPAIRFIIPLLIPLIAAIGALRQNNGASNAVTLVAFGLITVLVIAYSWRTKLFNASWLLFNIALGLLLSTSLRSWFISGFDISQEYQVFMMTLSQHHWDVNAIPGNAYNACLSLTTLPAALQQMTGISPEYIFKFMYQLLFALTGIVVYAIGRRFTGKRLAFLASFLYMVQAQFIGTMPAIGRQEIGILFFSLLVYTLLKKELSRRVRRWLLVIFSLGMVLSHYSTTYIAIIIIGTVMAAAILHRIFHKRLTELEISLVPRTLVKLVILLVLLSFVWYARINASSGNVYTTITSSVKNISGILNLTKGSQKTQLLLGGDTNEAISRNLTSYRDSLHGQPAIAAAKVDNLPVTSKPAAAAAAHLRDVLLIVAKVLLPLSPLLLLVFKRTRGKASDIAFAGLGASVAMAIVIVVPVVSANYNLERVYQQCLIILGITGLWALSRLMPSWKQLKAIVPTAFVLLFFLFTPGSAFINQFTGGSAARMNMNNSGEDYDKYYVYESEVQSATWVGNNCLDKPVYADRYGNLRVTAYAGVPFDKVRTTVLKGSKGACLMLDHANVTQNLYYTTYQKNLVRFTTAPSTFDQYNLLYTNGESKVYQY